ncbi:hypothetical protein COLO4_20575 [Corchorus olitorius]|uniref:Uncharacterized protein n=1 Tax=Corchorus olitorius TaxID=93759 RepID=A0A1R3IZ13_9ROSI|nr:hypothetical protein COLO4_20575 [Corchorus olitorius]
MNFHISDLSNPTANSFSLEWNPPTLRPPPDLGEREPKEMKV